jgi:cardiolipin synthase
MPARLAMAALVWTVAATIAATLIVVVVVINFRTPEEKIQHQVGHLYSIVDSQFEREMGTLLGPAILAGNRIMGLQNGDEVFPAMLKAIRAAEHTRKSDTSITPIGVHAPDVFTLVV